MEKVKKIAAENDPYWKNYHQLGIKTKDGKKVPNCVMETNKKNKKTTN